ncbi:hypothetical protein DPMN_189051 [Dreissena polymorpha]|uniref:Uncharacterized protein n=1 Tax=Dreissena polymorpha TaxID=45954 RepID=A0A9D4DST2_DREPO|nr:hypothetical protein DPMN_189051 [Dreissena polymorpha]
MSGDRIMKDILADTRERILGLHQKRAPALISSLPKSTSLPEESTVQDDPPPP